MSLEYFIMKERNKVFKKVMEECDEEIGASLKELTLIKPVIN